MLYIDQDAHWYIKNTWIGFSTRNIAKQAVVHHNFMAFWVLGYTEMEKLLPVAHKWLLNWNF